MTGEPDRDVGGTRRGEEQLPKSTLERTPLGPTRGNLIGEKVDVSFEILFEHFLKFVWKLLG